MNVAGTRPPQFYADNLHPLRNRIRTLMLKSISWESDVLGKVQANVRNPLLDKYFALTANIGAHTFYMIMLPLFFWYNNIYLGMNVIWVLAVGVSICGIMKDYLCLPRPSSPPLTRISMSKSALEEFGLPSTHSCNVISVAMVLHKFFPDNQYISITNTWLVSTLVLGRLYNGMHGFADITTGCFMGYLVFYFCNFIISTFSALKVWDNILVTAFLFALVHINPKIVEHCPCYEDTIAFCGVVLGLVWTLCFGVSEGLVFHTSSYGSVPEMVLYAVIRFVIGATCVIGWRLSSKRILTRIASKLFKQPLSAGVVMYIRIIIYSGIAPIVLHVAPYLFQKLDM